MRRLIPVCTLAMMAMSSVAAVLAAEAPGAPRLTEPIALSEKSASNLLVSPVSPVYPPVAKINYIQGKVRLKLLVSREGKVTAAHVVKGNAILAASALQAVREWLYRPLQTSSGPAKFLAPVEVRFTLQCHRTSQTPPLPLHPEEDLGRQIRAPEIVAKPDVPGPSSAVRLRVLVNEEGRPVDYEQLSGQPSAFSEARQVVDGWKFRPARWGTLAVPWYLEVDVQRGDSFLSSTGPEVGSQ